MHFGEVRVGIQHLFEVGDGFIQLALSGQRRAEIVVRFPVARVDLQGLPPVDDGLV